MEPSFYIHINCDICKETRYQSTRAFQKGDRPGPADFVSTDGGAAPLVSGDTPPLCTVCQSVMQAVPVPVEEEVPVPSNVRQLRPNKTASPRGNTEVLFQVEPDEMIHTVKDGQGYMTLITTKRVVRILL